MSRVHRWAIVAGVVAFGVLVSGCERPDPRLKSLSVGITKDSVLKIMGAEKPRRLDPYLIAGQYIEAMYYPKPGASSPEATQDRKMTPLIIVDNTLKGWGWTFWDSVASAHHIEVTPKK
jgi:hypothetical protein